MRSTGRPRRLAPLLALLLHALLLAACSSRAPAPEPAAPRGDIDSAPQALKEHQVAAIPDAVPRHEVRTRAGNANPYTVLGKTYHLLPDSRGYREVGVASWYGMKFHGRPTANGERYDVFGMTAAHRTLPIPSYVRVTNLANGRSVVVRVNDRGPFHDNRIIDLSWVAARKLGFADRGTARVEVVAVHADDPGTPVLQYAQPAAPASPAPQQQAAATPASAAPAEAAASPDDAPGTRRSWYLQVGAYRDYTVAQRVHLELDADLPGQVSIDSARDDGFHRVRVGPLGDDSSLQRVRAVLATRQISSPMLVRD